MRHYIALVISLFLSQTIYSTPDVSDSSEATRASRPGAPAVTSPISVVVPSLDLGAIQQTLASINCKIGNVDQDVCEDTILSVLGDACSILGISISEALSILLGCCQTDTLDISTVFTVLQDIKDTITECCSTITADFQNTWTILVDLKDTITNCGMPMAITQAMIPFVITEPGLYCVAEDLDGSGFADTIRIESNDVVLDLNQHQVLNSGGTSIHPALAVQNIVIKNGAIRNAVFGITVQANNVVIEDILFYQTGVDDIFLTGISADTPIDNISIINCQFFDGFIGIELGLTPVNNVIIDGCKFFQKNTGVFAISSSHNNLTIQNSVFEMALICIQVSTPLAGFIVENCVFNNTSNTVMLLAGIEDITIKSCIMDRVGGIAISLAAAITDVLIEDCNISECGTTGIDMTGVVTCDVFNSVINRSIVNGISIGVASSNISVRNCTILNQGLNGISIDGNLVVVENCDVRTSLSTGILVTSDFITINNCNIVENGGNGIDLQTTTSSVIVNNCNFNHNAASGIRSDGTSNTLTQNISTGNSVGILLDAASVNNYAHSNTTTSNSGTGFSNLGTNNHIYRNYSSFNTLDYMGVTPVNTPGGALTGTFDDFIANVEN